MSKYLIEQETLTDIADAIREKTGGTEEIKAEDFAAEISEIETGGGLPEKGLVFDDYDTDGYPHSARFVGTWTEIPNGFLFYTGYSNNSFAVRCAEIVIPDGVTQIGSNAFSNTYFRTVIFPNNNLIIGSTAFTSAYIEGSITFKKEVNFGTESFKNNPSLKQIICYGQVNQIGNRALFVGGTGLELLDFSHCSTIPPLFSSASMTLATGCIIRIPAALSDTTLGEGNGWESALNWNALTDIVWEVV